MISCILMLIQAPHGRPASIAPATYPDKLREDGSVALRESGAAADREGPAE